MHAFAFFLEQHRNTGGFENTGDVYSTTERMTAQNMFTMSGTLTPDRLRALSLYYLLFAFFRM